MTIAIAGIAYFLFGFIANILFEASVKIVNAILNPDKGIFKYSIIGIHDFLESIAGKNILDRLSLFFSTIAIILMIAMFLISVLKILTLSNSNKNSSPILLFMRLMVAIFLFLNWKYILQVIFNVLNSILTEIEFSGLVNYMGHFDVNISAWTSNVGIESFLGCIMSVSIFIGVLKSGSEYLERYLYFAIYVWMAPIACVSLVAEETKDTFVQWIKSFFAEFVCLVLQVFLFDIFLNLLSTVSSIDDIYSFALCLAILGMQQNVEKFLNALNFRATSVGEMGRNLLAGWGTLASAGHVIAGGVRSFNESKEKVGNYLNMYKDPTSKQSLRMQKAKEILQGHFNTPLNKAAKDSSQTILDKAKNFNDRSLINNDLVHKNEFKRDAAALSGSDRTIHGYQVVDPNGKTINMPSYVDQMHQIAPDKVYKMNKELSNRGYVLEKNGQLDKAATLEKGAIEASSLNDIPNYFSPEQKEMFNNYKSTMGNGVGMTLSTTTKDEDGKYHVKEVMGIHTQLYDKNSDNYKDVFIYDKNLEQSIYSDSINGEISKPMHNAESGLELTQDHLKPLFDSDQIAICELTATDKNNEIYKIRDKIINKNLGESIGNEAFLTSNSYDSYRDYKPAEYLRETDIDSYREDDLKIQENSVPTVSYDQALHNISDVDERDRMEAEHWAKYSNNMAAQNTNFVKAIGESIVNNQGYVNLDSIKTEGFSSVAISDQNLTNFMEINKLEVNVAKRVAEAEKEMKEKLEQDEYKNEINLIAKKQADVAIKTDELINKHRKKNSKKGNK